MRNLLILCGALCSLNTQAMTQQSFRENADLAIHLSNTNYNRLVVQQDKITQAHFPEGAMAVKGEEDGSLYVIVSNPDPFTMFLTTEQGHHFSATVYGESALGKTIEFLPSTPSKKMISPKASSNDFTLSHLMNEMINQKEIPGFKTKQYTGRTIRGEYGLVLLPKLTYDSARFKGEVIELYNTSPKTLNLNTAWFSDATVKAVSFSKTTLKPKEHGMLYRVMENLHG